MAGFRNLSLTAGGWSLLLRVVLFALVSIVSINSSAQISPGPLSRAHESLSGATNCLTCHTVGAGAANSKCLECHSEIASRLAARKGLHASFNLASGSGQQCASCHSEHNGRDFSLIKWDTKTFDHKQTGYALQGKHAALTCAQCHSAQHVSSAERATIKVKDLNRTFLGVSSACVTCHQDQHQGRLGANCAQCHGYTDWKQVSVGDLDHSRTRYPLTGLHANVRCEQCHTPGPSGKPRYAGIAFSQCSDCHSDPHRGSFARQSCQSCHNTGGWKRISSSTLSQNFDHSGTKFPLLGKHAAVACSGCHAGGDFKKPLAFQKCMDCHQPDPHKGQFAKRQDGGECASCHTVEGFKPSTFTVKEHQSTAYPLEGKHAALQCAQCHVPKGENTLFKMKFGQCTDCHSDEHNSQFAAAPYLNNCEKCHNLNGYQPSTFTINQHSRTSFALTEAHMAVPCDNCHKKPEGSQDKSKISYHWNRLSCTSCHADPHRGEFQERMQRVAAGKVLGCQACHSARSWKELPRFDHGTTTFALTGAHRATACIDCHRPPNLQTSLANVDFHAAPTRCEGCHDDIHGGQFTVQQAADCSSCHNPMKWKPSLFDHERRTSFSLQGAHAAMQCAACHTLHRRVGTKDVLFYKPTPKECADCHGAKSASLRPDGQSPSVR